jgi:uncharacterized protein (TIGR02099 family)
MTDTFPAPSRLLAATAVVATWALRLVAGGWLVLVLMSAALHFVIVPRIDAMRPWLEDQVARTVGTVVRIGSISAQSNGLIPSVELRGVQVLDADGRVALELSRVVAAVSPRSLLAGGLEQLYIDSPVLDVRRSADGAIWVAGFALPPKDSGDSAGADWLFSQPELAIRHGTLRWTDALRDAPPLELSDLDLVLRKRHFTHSLRINANPPAHWGERLSLQGVFTQPLWAMHAGRWQDWQGQWYTNVERLDWEKLRPYVDLGAEVSQGRGSVRAWIDVKRGAVTGATADVLLDDVHLGQGAQQQVLRRAEGRLAFKDLGGGQEYSTEGLQFETAEGVRWPGGNARLALWDGADNSDNNDNDKDNNSKAKGAKPARGEFSADRLDLAVLGQLAQRLPIDAALRTALQSYQPVGVVQTVQGGWTGPLQAPASYALKGRVTQAALVAQPGSTPGFSGLDLDLDLTHLGGKAHLEMANAALDLPGWFAEPALPLAQLSADVQWKKDGARLSASVGKLRFANADVQGEVQRLKWANHDASGALLPGPGLLDVQASLGRAELARVHRYLPLSMDHEVRDYLREAVRGGTASGGKLALKGDLRQLPFTQAKQGELRVSATLANGVFAVVPPSQTPKGRKPWPAFTQLSGELLIDRATFSLKGARAQWGAGAGQPGVPVERAEAQINNLYSSATVAVSLQGKTPLADALAVVNASALDDLIGQALDEALANGLADYRVKLDMPLADPSRMAVAGSLNLLGNDVQVLSGTPRLARARGQITFTDSGFGVNGVVGQALGGEMRVDGSLSGFGEAPAATASPSTSGTSGTPAAQAKPAPSVLRLQGTASAEGLRQASELGWVATSMARYATGSAGYQATIAMRAGAPEMVVSSNLMGLGLNLPSPFAKPAAAAMPVRLELGNARTGAGAASAAVPGQSQVRLDWGRLASVALVTGGANSAGQGAHLLRGAVVVGGAASEPLVLPERGISVNLALDTLDVDDWTTWLEGFGAPAPGAPKTDAASPALGADYLPTTLSLRVRELGWGSQTLHKVVASGSRVGKLWRAQVDATEFSGQIEYRQPSVPDLAADSANTGLLYARLSRLTLGSSEAQDVENLLDEQPASIPALDVVVDDFELMGKKLGRLEVEAVNQTSLVQREPQREWRLKRLNLSMPPATLSATGAWRLQPGAPSASAMSLPGAAKPSAKDRRRTALDFKLDISDSGDLLARFGMKDVIRQGKGKIEGQIDWQGSPISLDYPSMGGSFNVNLEKGEFLKADPGIAKLLGVLSLQSLPRRLMLDFRDVFAEGFPFDFVRGDVVIAKGIARTNNLQMKGVTAAVLMDGSTDIAKETQSIKVVVVPELNAGSASLITATINPLVGLYSFLAQLVLRQPLIAASTQELYIDGTWLDPRVTKVDRRTAPK